MFAFLLPKSAPFLAMLLEQNAYLRKTSSLMVRMLEKSCELVDAQKQITVMEEEADTLHSKIIRNLSRTFITPIDREDILRINQAQEECMDNMHSLTTRFSIFEFPRVRFPVIQISRTISSMVELTTMMLEGLIKRRDCHKTRAFRSMRDDCDMVLAAGLGELMDIQQDISPGQLIEILKWNQIYERVGLVMEHVITVAETIEEAVLKNV